MEVLVLMFVCGLAVATLVFWPLLHRAHRKAAESQQAAPHGEHALGASAVEHSATTPEASGSGEKTDRGGDGEATQPVAVEATAPKPREPEPMEMPELPTDIFDARYRARFNRSQRRLERIRAELDNAG